LQQLPHDSSDPGAARRFTSHVAADAKSFILQSTAWNGGKQEHGWQLDEPVALSTFEASLMTAIPATPPVAIGFALSFGGIAFVLFSRDVVRKRIVLPITLVLFSLVWAEIFRRTSSPTPQTLALVGLALIANGVWVYRRIGYCASCGRTMQDQPAGKLCNECAAAS
jgi:hypothetical protein